MVIVDTTVWIDYLRGTVNPETEWLNRELGKQPLGLLDLILCEVLQGISGERAFLNVERDLKKLQIFETGGVELAIRAAKNFQRLRREGKTVRKTVDCLIATFCIASGHALLHRDRDFDVFEDLGLVVIRP